MNMRDYPTLRFDAN